MRAGILHVLLSASLLLAATGEAADIRARDVTVEINAEPTEKSRADLQLHWLTAEEDVTAEEPPLPPADFNPDPGVVYPVEPEPPPDLFPPLLPQLPDYGEEPLPRSLGLPRRGVHEVEPRRDPLKYPEYPETETGYPPGDQPVPNRWFIGFGRWQRYADPSAETPYQQGAMLRWHPYLQSLLKGDAPIIGQNIFMNLTAASFAQFELRRLPVPSGVSTARPDSADFFGRSEQLFFSNDFQIGIDIFKGETAFKPVDWAIRLLHVYNLNYTDLHEANILDPDPRGSEGNRTSRYKDFFALQEAFFEFHIRDLTDNYDFISSRFGIQPFVSDFRGFIFNDSNLGVRIFGNYDNNRWQFNLAFFDMREKDTYSELNDFNSRNQYVFIANVFRQDFPVRGYTSQLSFHASLDEATRRYSKDGFLVRPAPIGGVRDHYVQSYYLGWTGDGHIGLLNITNALYLVLGEDSFNGLANRRVTIFGQMAALELSVDKDWLRHKVSFFYASGDDDPRNGQASGFDTILDRPFFIGGPFSYYVRQGFNLAGTFVNFKQRDSLIPNFRSSKIEGQANFVNPGAVIIGYGADAEVTPKIKAFANINYIWTVSTEPTRQVLFTNHASHEIGLDVSVGVQWRPMLTDNLIVSAGFGALIPGAGYKDIYRANTRPVPGFPQEDVGPIDDFLYSALLTVTLTY